MKISFDALKKRGPLQRIAIRSTELSLYLAEIELDGKPYVICDNDNKPLKSHNLVKLRDQLSELDVVELVLVQDSAYDEMIGQPEREHGNRMEVPLDTNGNSPAPWLN